MIPRREQSAARRCHGALDDVGRVLESMVATIAVSLRGRHRDKLAEIAPLLWVHFLCLAFVLSRSGPALAGLFDDGHLSAPAGKKN